MANPYAECARAAVNKAIRMPHRAWDDLYCCNLLSSPARRQLPTKPLLAEFENLFGDATFWVRDRLSPDYPLDPEQRYLDRVCCLLLFAEILESEDAN